MRKALTTLALVLTMILTAGISVNAEEPTQDPEARFNERIEIMTENHEARIEEAQATFESSVEEALARQARKLELVDTYAPELYSDYEAGFAEHISVHEDLHETRIELREDGFDGIIEGLIDLKDEVFAQAEAGEITFREAAEDLRAYLETERLEVQEKRDDYNEAIADLLAEEEANHEIVEGLKEELRAAIEAGEDQEANEIIETLYDYLQLHIEFDLAKLAIMETFE